MSTAKITSPFLGPQSVIYPTSDLVAAKAWYTNVLGVEPYFDEPGYVGFNVNGYELGLFPGADPQEGPLAYWGVRDITSAHAHLLSCGASEINRIHDVGGGIRMSDVQDMEGFHFGLIQNANFSACKDANDAID